MCGVLHYNVLNETQGCSLQFKIVLLYNTHLHCVHSSFRSIHNNKLLLSRRVRYEVPL